MKKRTPFHTARIRAARILTILTCFCCVGCKDKGDPIRDSYTGPASAKQTQPQRAVTIRTSDGWTLTGDLFTPEDKPIAGTVLLHQREGSAGDWRDLCDALRRKGIVALAIDQRGAGRSTSPDAKLNGKNAPWDTSNDIAASVKWLVDGFGDPKHGPESFNIGLVGASYGANNALIYAAAHSDQTQYGSIKSIVLFSPGANYNGLDAVKPARQWTGPIAIFYATYDNIAGLGPNQIRDVSPSHDKVTRQIDDDNHGTGLLSDDTIDDTVVFLKRTLQ